MRIYNQNWKECTLGSQKLLCYATSKLAPTATVMTTITNTAINAQHRFSRLSPSRSGIDLKRPKIILFGHMATSRKIGDFSAGT